MDHSNTLGVLFLLAGFVAQIHLRLLKLEQKEAKWLDRAIPRLLFGMALLSFVVSFALRNELL